MPSQLACDGLTWIERVDEALWCRLGYKQQRGLKSTQKIATWNSTRNKISFCKLRTLFVWISWLWGWGGGGREKGVHNLFFVFYFLQNIQRSLSSSKTVLKRAHNLPLKKKGIKNQRSKKARKKNSFVSLFF